LRPRRSGALLSRSATARTRIAAAWDGLSPAERHRTGAVPAHLKRAMRGTMAMLAPSAAVSRPHRDPNLPRTRPQALRRAPNRARRRGRPRQQHDPHAAPVRSMRSCMGCPAFGLYCEHATDPIHPRPSRGETPNRTASGPPAYRGRARDALRGPAVRRRRTGHCSAAGVLSHGCAAPRRRAR